MNLYFHGGKCCGIKTIAGFPWYGDEWQSAEVKKAARNSDAYGHNVSTGTPFFTDEAPREMVEPRLQRLIAFCKRERPKGAIEVTLARAPNGSCNQIKVWEPLLLKLGFKVTVPEFLNSNSGNYIKIYHLVYDATTEPKPKTAITDPFGRSE